MTSSLTPQKRPDKNGKLVTRHVRTGGTDSASGRAIPSPVTLFKERTVEQAATELLDLLENAEGRAQLKDNFRSWRMSEMEKLPGTRGIDMVSECASNPDTAEIVPGIFKEVLNRSEEPEVMDRRLTFYFSAAGVHHTMKRYSKNRSYADTEQDLNEAYSKMGFDYLKRSGGDLTDENIAVGKTMVIMNMLGCNESNFALPYEYYSVLNAVKDDCERVERCASVLSGSELTERFSTSFTDEIKSVCDAVESSGYEPEQIADLMWERRVSDVNLALEMMNTSTKPLYSGVL